MWRSRVDALADLPGARHPGGTDAEALIADGVAAPVEGWDFPWFAGRSTEQRPSLGYASPLAERLGAAPAALDLQADGGEVWSWALRRADRQPGWLAATNSGRPTPPSPAPV